MEPADVVTAAAAVDMLINILVNIITAMEDRSGRRKTGPICFRRARRCGASSVLQGQEVKYVEVAHIVTGATEYLSEQSVVLESVNYACRICFQYQPRAIYMQ